MNRGAPAPLLLAALAALAAAGCTRLPSGPARHVAPPVRAAILADWSADGYARPVVLEVLDTIAASGANGVTILVTAYQADAHAAALRAFDPRTPAAAAVRAAADAALARGLAVSIKPHVDVDDGTWRAHIDPPDAAAWFASYRAFLLPWARLADSLGAVRFVAGTELAGTIGHEAEWRTTIAALRAAFRGRLVYAASWDEARIVPFWDALDLVGIDFYYPVAVREEAGRYELLAGWAPWLARLERLHERSGKRILLTEIGYRSIAGAGIEPHAFGSAGAIDLAGQADLYWAALQATGDLPWMEGLEWWNFRADGAGGPADGDFTPYGKPAALELRAAWAP